LAVPSKARNAFEDNYTDVERLLEIHSDLTGNKAGKRRGVEVLNKSGIVLMCAVWEAYCEDIAAETIDHVIEHAPNATVLSKTLRKNVAAELKADLNGSAMWKLADAGWRDYLRSRTQAMAKERNRNLNAPKTENIKKLFDDTLGLPKVPEAWYWAGMSTTQAAKKLDGFVSLRGDIAHRARAAETIKKTEVWDFAKHVERLVDKTDAYINRHITKSCGTALF
jgi:hypothetical protein